MIFDAVFQETDKELEADFGVIALDGSGGTGGAGVDASQVTYDGSEEYISATNVEEALKKTSNHIIDLEMAVAGKANEFHEHDAGEVRYVMPDYGIEYVGAALNHLFSQVGNVSSALDELHAYAQALVNGGGTE